MGTPRYSIVVPLDNEREVLSEPYVRLRAAVTSPDGPVEARSAARPART